MLSQERYDLLLKRFKYDDGSIIMELMKDENTINLINSCEVEKLMILLDSNHFRNNLITRLQDFNVIESGNSVETQATEIKQFASSKNSLQYEKLELLLDYDKESNNMIMDMLENPTVVEVMNGIDYERFKLLFNWSDYMKSMALNLIEESFVNVMDSSNIRIFKFLIEYEKSYDVFMKNLLEERDIIDVINSLEIKKLEILLDHEGVFYKTMKNVFELLQKSTDNKSGFPSCEIHVLRKESALILEILEVVLNEEDIVSTINAMNMEKFMHLLYYGFRDTTSLKILESVDAMNTVNSLDIEKLELFLTTAAFDEKMIRIMESKEAAKAIGSIAIEEFISNSRKLRVSIILKILELKSPIGTKILETIMKIGNYACEKVYDFIESLGLERLSILINRYDYAGANNNSELLITKALSEKNIFEAISEINILKLKILLNRTVYNDTKILSMLEDETSLDLIETMDFERFKIIHETFGNYSDTVKEVVMEPGTFDIVRSLCSKKMELLLKWLNDSFFLRNEIGQPVRNLLHNSLFVSFLKLINIEKFDLIRGRMSYSRQSLEFLLRNTEVILNMDIEKFIFAFTSGLIFRERLVEKFLGDNCQMTYLLNSISIEKFKIICDKIEREECKEIFENTEFDVRKHLLFSVALIKGGVIRRIRLDHLSNEDEALHNDIVKVFPKNIPIHRMLEKATTVDKAMISRLEDMCIEACIETFGRQRIAALQNNAEE